MPTGRRVRSRRPPRDFEGLMETFSHAMREIYGDLGSLVIPYEVVCPPIDVERLPELEAVLEALRQEGAQGTRDNLLHAFGVQLNPEIATKDPYWVLAVLKAEILLSEWLRSIISVDMARRFLAFADPFPKAYIHHFEKGILAGQRSVDRRLPNLQSNAEP